MKIILIVCGLTLLTSCHRASRVSQTAISAASLSREYKASSAGVRSKYDGKEIVVRGFAALAVKLPGTGDDQGSVSLVDRDSEAVWPVTCWFSREQSNAFSKIKNDQYVTVAGVFNGEAGVNLKFCKLVTVE